MICAWYTAAGVISLQFKTKLLVGEKGSVTTSCGYFLSYRRGKDYFGDYISKDGEFGQVQTFILLSAQTVLSFSLPIFINRQRFT